MFATPLLLVSRAPSYHPVPIPANNDLIGGSQNLKSINVCLSFVCEDKPTQNTSIKDMKKTRKLRENSFVYWKSLLRCSDSLRRLSSISCRFNKLNLSITGTKIIDNTTVHMNLKEVSISVSDRSGGAIADFLSVVISLMRSVVRNIETIEAIIQVIHEDNLNFLEEYLWETQK